MQFQEDLLPVLKMPPSLTFSALRALAETEKESYATKRQRLVALQPTIPERTLLNAYVLPSMKQLGLFVGTLRDGHLTRYGEEVLRVLNSGNTKVAEELIAKQLLHLDSARVGLVCWMRQSVGSDSPLPRRALLTQFLEVVQTTSPSAENTAKRQKVILDRLGKWLAYLLFFGVLREKQGSLKEHRLVALEPRQIAALNQNTVAAASDVILRGTLLDAYADCVRRYGTRLYIPIAALRDELGRTLQREDILATDFALDDILRRTKRLLPNHTVTFSPFSGPASGGLTLGRTYMGFVSIRASSSPSKGRNAKKTLRS